MKSVPQSILYDSFFHRFVISKKVVCMSLRKSKLFFFKRGRCEICEIYRHCSVFVLTFYVKFLFYSLYWSSFTSMLSEVIVSHYFHTAALKKKATY